MKPETLKTLQAHIDARQAVARIVDLSDGTERVIPATAVPADDPLADALADGFRTGRSGVVAGPAGDVFLDIHEPPLRLILIGAVHIAQAVSSMALAAEYRVHVVDPRTAFATDARFPGVELDTRWPDDALPDIGLDIRTAVCALTHDPKIDDPALVEALRSPAFYIGALGSRRTHAKRNDRLRDAGFGDADLARIRAPIGLDIGAVGAVEIAVSVMAEITSVLRQRS